MFYFRFVKRRVRRVASGQKEYKKHREQARCFVLQKIAEVNKVYNFSFNRIAIRNTRTRWGSCSKKRNLNFNYRILFLPDRLATYIVAHELCHLQEFNHSKNFWNLVELAVPDCRVCSCDLKAHRCWC